MQEQRLQQERVAAKVRWEEHVEVVVVDEVSEEVEEMGFYERIQGA